MIVAGRDKWLYSLILGNLFAYSRYYDKLNI